MEIEIKKLQEKSLKQEFSVTIPAKILKESIEVFLNEKQKNTKIPGFRPGKVPQVVLYKSFGDEALEKSLQRYVQESVDKIVEENKLELALAPKYEKGNPFTFEDVMEGEKNVEIKLSFELMPEIPEIDLKALTLTSYNPEVEIKYLEKKLEEIAMSHKTSIPFEEDRKAQIGDTLVYNLEYVLPSGEIKHMDGAFELGSGVFPKEFEDTLVGSSAGHVINERLRVPKNFSVQELAGKKVLFKVAFSEVRKTVPHKADELFAKSMGCKNLEEYKEKLKKQIETYGKKIVHTLQRKQIEKLLQGILDFPIPESLEEETFKEMWDKQMEALENPQTVQEREQKLMEATGKNENELKQEYRKKAQDSVRFFLFIGWLIRNKNFTVSQEELSRSISLITDQYQGNKEDVINYYKKNPREIQKVQDDILNDKAVQWIIEQCSKEEKKISIKELEQLIKGISSEELEKEEPMLS